MGTMNIGQELARFGREIVRWNPPPQRQHIERWGNPSFQAWADAFLTFQGQIYGPGYTTSYGHQKVEPVVDSFLGYLTGAYKANGIIFAVSMARARPFSEVTFKFRRYGQVGGGNDLFGNADLQILETPWPGGTTQSLLMRAEQDITAAGTFFVAREDSPRGDRLRRLRPDWVEFILSAPPDEAVAADIVGYKYTPGGRGKGESKLYLLDECTHWSPIPDPDALYRGMSWLSPVIEEMQADKAATTHKLKFFENAATPNLSVSLKETVSPEKFADFARKMDERNSGVDNAYKTLYTGGGADVRVIGADMQQLDFSSTQGHGETRVAAAGGVPPIVVGLSEGLAAATYSNYGQARRAFGDMFLRSQWRSLCGAIAPIIVVPEDAQLWYDAADVAFLREDQKDLAEILSKNMATINAAVSAGWTPESAQSAILAEDLSLLKHSGRVSVQLQPINGQEEEVAQTELTGKKVEQVAKLAGSPFSPESIVEAVDAGDLAKLEVQEEEPPSEEEPLEDEVDPEADDALAAAIDGMEVPA